MKNICKRKKGMTLIEAIISVALFSLLIIPISGIIMNSVKTNKKAEVKQNAAYVGQQVLEEIGTYDYVTLSTNADGDKFFQLLDGDEIVQQAVDSYIGIVESDKLPKNYRVTVSLQKDNSFTYQDKNNLSKYNTVPWKFDFTSNTFKLYSPTADGSYGEKIQGTTSGKLIMTIDDSSRVELLNLVGEPSSASLNKTFGDDNKILLYLTDASSVTYPDIEIRNKGISIVTVYVVKENPSNKMKVSTGGGKIIIYNDLLANEDNKVGELYNINVVVSDMSTGDEIFNGHTTSNIVFK